MKVDTMRYIDRWAGVPLTFLFTVVLWIWEKLQFKKKGNPDLSRTLFIELSEMGSAVLVDPAMRKLRDEGKAELFFVIFESNYISLEILKTVESDKIFRMRSENIIHLVIDVIGFMLWCRKNRITTVIDLELFSRFTALLTGLSGSSSRIGFATFHDEGMYRGNLINFPVRYNPHVHIAVNFISLINTALGKHPNPYPTQEVTKQEIQLSQVEFSDQELQNIREKIIDLFPSYNSQRIVLINANASDLLPQRRWLPENFISLSKKLLSNFEDILIIATGSPGEKAYVQKVVDGIDHERCVNSAGYFKFLELIPLYFISEVMLTNDSGPGHFSAVTPLKTFVIFGPETPALYGSLGNSEPIYLGLPCSPCVSAANHRKTTCETRPCITGISTDFVADKMIKYLK